MTEEQSLIDRLRCTIPTEASQQSRLTFQQRAMLDAAAEIERLRSALRLAAVELFGQCDPLTTSPDDLVRHFYEEARRG
jgi:hypothetical protein